jgi:site-specific DNA-cytosine methylase
MNILSLFDGISCAQVAINRIGIKEYSYYASEVDKYAIKITQKNFQNTIQLGDITKIGANALPDIDLLIGGSPCQGFSLAGKQLNFNDERSALFFEYVRILKEVKPKYFLLENVNMKQEYQDVISGLLGVKPVKINSALVSAQNRVRLYWTNIENIVQPNDKKIYLGDIIESGICDRDKSYCIDANYFKGGNPEQYFSKKILSTIHKENAVSVLKRNKKVVIVYEKPHGFNMGGFSEKEKFNTLRFATSVNYKIYDGIGFRKLTPLECERLQTLTDEYTLVLAQNGKQIVSDTQRYKALGNAFTVDIIAHILSFLKIGEK